MSSGMKSFVERFERLPVGLRIAVCLLMSLLLGAADYFTGDFSLTLLYVLPIAVSLWFVGKRTAFCSAAVCSVELYCVGFLGASGTVSVVSLRSWNALMEVGCLLLVAYLLSLVCAEMKTSQRRAIELESLNYDLLLLTIRLPMICANR
jgi:K+-sensing histidine kinase KdpD